MPRTFRLPRSAYLVVLLLVLGVTPLVQQAALAVVYLVPAVVAAFIARTATIVDRDGIAVRALVGRRSIAWADVRGLSVTGRSVYAVVDGGAVRMPCVRVSDLGALSAASDGHLPVLPEATPKYAPSRRARR